MDKFLDNELRVEDCYFEFLRSHLFFARQKSTIMLSTK